MSDCLSRRAILGNFVALGLLTVTACARGENETPAPSAPRPRTPAQPPPNGRWRDITDAQWRARLTPEQYRVLRHEGTERAFTGEFWNHHAAGTYTCAGCGLELFASDTKFESGTGWPSFFRPIAPGRVGETTDESLFMRRTEVHCERCGGHLGHVFNDGPPPTGLRYCINSVSIGFVASPG